MLLLESQDNKYAESKVRDNRSIYHLLHPYYPLFKGIQPLSLYNPTFYDSRRQKGL